MRDTTSELLRGASLLAAMSALAVAGPVYAQQANPGEAVAADGSAIAAGAGAPTLQSTPSPSVPQAVAGNEIVVTGTAIRGVAPVGSATVNITRDTITQSGVRDPASLITQLPQASLQGTTLGNSGGRSAGVNLRGLGNNATLLLLDGHRAVNTGVQTTVPDPSIIPFGAIERVEVVTDGASAVYGSDAVAGVVNYIFRKPFDGAEITARYTDTLYHQGNVDATFGRTWNGGGLLISGSFETNDDVSQGDVPQLRADLRRFGGNDNRLQGTTFFAPGAAGAIIVGNTVYGMPSNLNGRTPTTAEVSALKNNVALVDGSDYSTYYTASQRKSVLARVVQDFGKFGDISLTGMYSRRTNAGLGGGDGAFQAVAVAIPTSSPYYVPGLGTGSESVVYNFRLNNPGRSLTRHDFENTYNIFADYHLPLFGDFRFTGSGSFGVSKGCATCQPQPNTILTSFIENPATASEFNPYLQGPQSGADGIFGVFIQKVRNQNIDFLPKVDGSLVHLPGGNVRIAIGGEFTRTNYKQESDYTLNPTTTLQVFRYANVARNVYSAFGEAYIPIFGSENAIPGFQKLDLSAAIRYDHYSDFGSTKNPKFGVTWKPFHDLQLRGSYGTSFRAPTLAEENFNVVGAANRTSVADNIPDIIPVTNPANGTTNILVSTFRFTPLKPERAKILSFGGDYTPSWLPGMKLGVTFYDVRYKDRISALPNTASIFSSAANYQLYKQFFTLAPQPASCVNGSVNGNPGAPQYATYNPAYLPYLEASGSYPPTTINDCSLQGVLNAQTLNLGKVEQSGLDFTLNYMHDVGFGTLSIDGAFTYVLRLKRNLLPGAPMFDALDTIGDGNTISKRGRLSVGLTHGIVSGNVAVNYTGGYLNNLTPTVNGVHLPNQQVPSWTTFDLNLSLAPETNSSIFKGLRFTISARNVTDKAPPVVLSTQTYNGFPTAVDLNNANVFGRILTLEVSTKF